MLIVIAAVVVIATRGTNKPSGGSASTVTQPGLSSGDCPLTDLPAAGGVPNRPALAVKIGNEPQGARPQSGLNEADIVYDTPAEGFIMRYVAVFQCNNVTSIGPVRSVRFVDWHILRTFIHPILAFAGGINPNLNAVQSLGWLAPANLLSGAQAAGTRISSRVPPDNLYTSTAGLYGLFPKAGGAPPPVFSYSSATPAGATPATALMIDFSQGTDVQWKWNAAGNDWLHTYQGQQDVDALTNAPVSTTNIVVQVVHYVLGPYAESTGGSGDVESQTIGSGPGWVLRNGTSIKVTWHRKNLIDPTTYTDANGSEVKLAPGRTWVEIVPNTTANTPGRLTITG